MIKFPTEDHCEAINWCWIQHNPTNISHNCLSLRRRRLYVSWCNLYLGYIIEPNCLWIWLRIFFFHFSRCARMLKAFSAVKWNICKSVKFLLFCLYVATLKCTCLIVPIHAYHDFVFAYRGFCICLPWFCISAYSLALLWCGIFGPFVDRIPARIFTHRSHCSVIMW